MVKRDLLLSLFASYLIAFFGWLILVNLGYIDKIPYSLSLIFVAFPIISVFGMTIASFLGKKIKILWQVAKFGIVGVLNTAMDFGIFNVLIGLTKVAGGSGIVILNIVSFSIAIINSYFWNKAWVFSGNKKGNFITFAVVTLIGLAINTGTVFAITTYIGPLNGISDAQWANIAKVFATGLSMVWNFLGYKLIVFE